MLSEETLAKLERIKKKARYLKKLNERKNRLIRDMQNIPYYCSNEVCNNIQKEYTELEKGEIKKLK